MTLVENMIDEQKMKRDKFKSIYKEILEAELVPYISEEIMIKRYIRERVIKSENTLNIEFKLFWPSNYGISIQESIENICFEERFFQKLFLIESSFWKRQVKYLQYNLKTINDFSFITDLINYKELVSEIFRETTIPQQLIELGKSFGCESNISYMVEEHGEPIWELSWQPQDTN